MQARGWITIILLRCYDIYVKDLKCKKVNVAALVLQGTEEKPIYNVTFDNVDVDKAGIGLGFSNTKTIGVSNCNWEVDVGVPSTARCERWYIRINRFV